MRAPDFWAGPGRGGWQGALLHPVSLVWAAVTRRRLARGVGFDPGIPVVCVGNVTAGGTGKTPVAQAIARRLIARGVTPHFLSRGYGGSLAGPVRVGEGHDASMVGDEPLLLARVAPAWVARDRVAGARAIAAAGADVIIMDDGFQNPGVAKTLSLLVLDGGAGLGNGRVIPAGPLRETWGEALLRADAVVVNGRGAPLPDCAGLPVLHGGVLPTAPGALAGRRVLAFAGIGRPGKFFDTVRDMGAVLVGQQEFPDHHPYTADEIRRLMDKAAALDAAVVTTAKDAVRLPAGLASSIEVVEVGFAFDDVATLDQLLDRALRDRVSKTP